MWKVESCTNLAEVTNLPKLSTTGRLEGCTSFARKVFRRMMHKLSVYLSAKSNNLCNSKVRKFVAFNEKPKTNINDVYVIDISSHT